MGEEKEMKREPIGHSAKRAKAASLCFSRREGCSRQSTALLSGSYSIPLHAANNSSFSQPR